MFTCTIYYLYCCNYTIVYNRSSLLYTKLHYFNFLFQRRLIVNNHRKLTPPISFDAQKDPCGICNRPISRIHCTRCGHIFQGRVRTECMQHKNVVYLMDISNCPQCKVDALYLSELKIFNGSKQVNDGIVA